MSKTRKWKIIEHSWRNTSIENEDGRIVCELDLESFDDLNENNQDKYEQLQRADAELIASAPALRDERDRLRANLINCSERLAAYYGDNYPAVVDARAALTPAGARMKLSRYWENQGKTLSDRRSDGRTFKRSNSTAGCAECCNGDRCDDMSHYDRQSCPFCLGTGEPAQVQP